MSEKEYLINWFVVNSSAGKAEIINNATQNFFETGWIDSLKFINFIIDLEQEFSIRFSNNDFQDRAFATIDGLSHIIQEKKNAAK
jgi:acyl carrier protein